ncbi:hypothetical protein AURDEDRAFT_176457 [Auricularia subglabra TFB-10046 SS5]|uniref:Uncharacterized protein n=1 Tax=Auricularia subglabra (strain TFB-10046 / SS5) TaxID=717982 RepID=J0WRE4_AURST|nr:hypothetical protein AURDEDRAFT_176457 [Auricularia subglabra TFB-10046 SS5]
MFHHGLRRLACAALVGGISAELGDVAKDPGDARRSNKFALYLLALLHPAPCSKAASAAAWAHNFEAALAVAMAILLAPHAVCIHVAEEATRVFVRVEEECGHAVNDERAAHFCEAAAGMGYRLLGLSRSRLCVR